MDLKELLTFIKSSQEKIEQNKEDIDCLKAKQQTLLQENTSLEKEIEKAKKIIYKQKFLQVNISELFYEICNTLGHYDGYLTFRPIHKTIKLSKKDLPTMKKFLQEKTLCIDLSFSHYLKPYMYYDFKLEYPLKDILLSDGKKLINCLTVEDNAIVVPKELESKILVNISLNDRAMTENVFKKCVLKCIEKSETKNNDIEKI